MSQGIEIGLDELKARALRGDMTACFELGDMYLKGEEVPRDPLEAVDWLRRAADQDLRFLTLLPRDQELVQRRGVALAQTRLALCYLNHEGVISDFVEAEELFQKAAQLGSAEAQLNLGRIFLDRATRSVDVKNKNALSSEAFTFIQHAAEQGLKEAIYELAICYRDGVGTELDPHMVFKLSYQAAKQGPKPGEQGHAGAQFLVAECFKNGVGVAPRPDKALDWLNKSAAQNYPEALVALAGVHYVEAFKPHQDPIKSDELLKTAANLLKVAADPVLNNPEGQYFLGKFYLMGWGIEEGLGIEKSRVLALSYFQKAAEQNHIKARTAVGCCHYMGWGLQDNPTLEQHNKNLAEAANQWKLASLHGDHEAIDYLLLAYKSGFYKPASIQETFLLCSKAVCKVLAEDKDMLCQLGHADMEALKSFALENVNKLASEAKITESASHYSFEWPGIRGTAKIPTRWGRFTGQGFRLFI